MDGRFLSTTAGNVVMKAQGNIDWPSTVGSIGELVSNVLPMIYGLAGLALFGLFIYGGYMWLTSTGDPDKVRKGVDTLVNAVIGIVIIVFAYLATRIVAGILGFSSPLF